MWLKKIIEQNGIFLALAPMADMTDSPFCRIVKKIGGCDVVFREMVSSEAVVRGNEKTLKMIDFTPEERPIVQQIFGADPKTMAKAAKIIVEKFHPDGIDINMGCPAKKIVGNFNGCALMKEPIIAGEIIRAVKKAVSPLSVSVKMRLGWSGPDEFKTFIPIIEEAGADLITLHGRTRAQGYSGKADWDRIRQAKEIARVPLLANGDVHEPEQVSECLRITGADGVSIARGVLGNPWFFRDAKYENYEITKWPVNFHERRQIILEHAKLHLERYGERSMVSFRKHLLWYFKSRNFDNFTNLKEIRVKLTRVSSYAELELALSSLSTF